MFEVESINLMGLKVDKLKISDIHQLMKHHINQNNKVIIANHNLHSAYLYHKDSKMKKFYEIADYIHIDGMPLVFIAKLLGYTLLRSHRVTYVDWIPALMKESEKLQWKIFYLGSKPGIAQRGFDLLRKMYPTLQIEVHHGYFSMEKMSKDNEEIINKINSYSPNILMIGMGMPRQEHWILENLNELKTNILLPCGACIDYVAGEVRTPPRWMGQLGLEWIFRLFWEPKRLWQRYLIEPWFLLRFFIKDVKSKFSL